MEPLVIARSVHCLFGADIRDWNNAMQRQAFWYRGAVRLCLSVQMPHFTPTNPRWRVSLLNPSLSEDAVLIVRVLPPINLGRAVLQPS